MNKENKYNLVEGGILNKLFFVALPIIGTQIVQMTYNLADMFWLGRLGSDAVAASGTVGLFIWMSMAFGMFGRMGAEIGVSQNLGRGDRETARDFSQNAIATGFFIGLALMLVYIAGNGMFIGLFRIQEAYVEQSAREYLSIVSMGLPLHFVTMAITGTFNGSGNSRVTLLINGVGFVVNMTLDPVLIFVLNLGIRGAAVATVIAQACSVCVAIMAIRTFKSRPFERVTLLSRPQLSVLRRIFKWVTPISVENFLFTFLTMLVSAQIMSYGSDAMAASRVGTQIESLSWLITIGFASALTAFVGQNYGAGKWTRIHRCIKIASGMMIGWGVIVSLLLYFGANALYTIFLPNDPQVVGIGAEYLKILALAQIPGCLEGVASGAFKGLGKTLPPSIASGTTNILRVVLAYFLSRHTPLGLTGIWIALAAGAAVRGTSMYIWHLVTTRSIPAEDTGGF